MTGRRQGLALPPFIKPCLAVPARTPPDGPHWVHEIKYDGYRVQAHVARGRATLLTRNGLDWTARFGRVVDELAALPVRTAILDGEAIVQDAAGVAQFDALTLELHRGRLPRIIIMAFDLLFLDGQDLRPRPLRERKAKLDELLARRSERTLLQYSAHMTGDAPAIFAAAARMHLEGIVSKRLDAPYRSGRGGDWVKAKCLATDDFVIVGYAVSKADKAAVGALALGFYEAGALVYAGRVGTGFTHDEARALFTTLAPLGGAAPKLTGRLRQADTAGLRWVAPRLVAHVAYRNWTRDGLIRHAVYRGLRADKPAATVTRPVSPA